MLDSRNDHEEVQVVEHARLDPDRRRTFWKQLNDRATGRDPSLVTGWRVDRAPALHVRLSSALGSVTYDYAFIDGKWPAVWLRIYVPHDRERNQRWYEALVAHRDEIGMHFGGQLKWRREPDKNLGAFITHHIEPQAHDENRWPELQEAMLRQMHRLRGTLDPYLEALAGGRSLADVARVRRSQPPPAPAPRRVAITKRILRDSAATLRVKDLYDCTCQICGTRLETPGGAYAEGAHVRPVKDGGPDVEENILCLCPNHHVLFDYGAITITPTLEIRSCDGESLGALTCHPDHFISAEYFVGRAEKFKGGAAQGTTISSARKSC
jgi:hypothetical protein